ncbi:DNA-binding transcriptional MocR family regulator [Sinobacterium caligoides]|uniref:DNA-binding transcriptional MocR family regulator n=1 Tax=Sinobacterium caligoides TaxID=933926 RepID=A0A3N2DPG7_9GAMM|nr:PLP-dependent aminotransferase family protein [Sinobacterium caligoides]ROS01697.1 DNA-binding transcriptional MocR family regulator [Sinobacterium caligoides]
MRPATHIETLQPSYIREILSAASADGVISLAGGLPAAELFPCSLLEQAMTTVATQKNVFQYGETQGYAPLIAHLQSTYQLDERQSVLVTTGSQQGLDLIARAYINPGDGVVMEAPSYLGALQVFTVAQARIETVPQTEQGPDLAALAGVFATGNIKLFYAVPDFHNPTGVCWSLQTRLKVAELCDKYSVSLIEDAPYRELRFSGESLPLVSSFCSARAFVLRSFSKTSAPGLRLGVVTGPRDWLIPMVRIKQAADLHSSLPMQAVLLEILKHAEFADHLKNVQMHYQQRYHALVNGINKHIQSAVSFNTVEGGMFIWLELSKGNPEEIARKALAEGVAVVPGTAFYPGTNAASKALRLNFSHCSPEQLVVAIKRLNNII